MNSLSRLDVGVFFRGLGVEFSLARLPQDWPCGCDNRFAVQQLGPDIEGSSQDPSASGRRMDGFLPEVGLVNHVAKLRMWNRTSPNFSRHAVND